MPPSPNLQPQIDAVISAASVETNPEFSDELRAALQAITGLEEEEDRTPVCAELAARLPEIPAAIGAGAIAIVLGAQVEGGMAPDVSGDGVRKAFLKWCREWKTAPEGNDPPVDNAVVQGLEFMGRSLVAHLSRSLALLEQARQDSTFMSELERLRDSSNGAMWVAELVSKCSGELVVIHVKSRQGFRLAYRHLSNCFHLFTLLQAALAGKLPGAKKPGKELLALARGEGDGPTNDEAWWHYGPGNVPECSLAASIWGEASPVEIPRVAGEQVLLLWPMILGSRFWDAGFFGPRIEAAPSSVEIIRPLTAEELNEWWTRLDLAGAAARSEANVKAPVSKDGPATSPELSKIRAGRRAETILQFCCVLTAVVALMGTYPIGYRIAAGAASLVFLGLQCRLVYRRHRR